MLSELNFSVMKKWILATWVAMCVILAACNDDEKVKEEPASIYEQVVSGTLDDHDYVDLGLPSGTLWATCNVGATTFEAYGNEFAWGETRIIDNWRDYVYKFGERCEYTKYCTELSDGVFDDETGNRFVDNKTLLEAQDDAATEHWGEHWCMPTGEQCMELKEKCVWEKIKSNGQLGSRVTGPNGNSIFLPTPDKTNVEGGLPINSYWSSTLGLSDPYLLDAVCPPSVWECDFRDVSQYVRPVVSK